MDEKKESQRESGVCFDNMGVEELKDLMGKDGIGSLCREMMSKVIQSEKGESACDRFMKHMIGKRGETKNSNKSEEHEKAL